MSATVPSGDSGRLLVRSPDGVAIAVWEAGDGPPLVLVHGSLGDHTAWAVPLEELRKHFTTFAVDRRGFGASGDGAAYTIEKDFEDVASVVDFVATRTDRPVILWGHSYGANCAMGGANLSSWVDRLVLYEPSLGLAYPPGAIDSMEAALAEDDRETAVIRLLVDALEMTPGQVDALRASPRWPNLLAGAHTGPRECRVEEAWTYRPGQFDDITAPTLLLSGGDSPRPLIEATQRASAAIPNAEVRVLHGHGHFAHRTDPEMVVGVIKDWL